jgi:hypothetical protein
LSCDIAPRENARPRENWSASKATGIANTISSTTTGNWDHVLVGPAGAFLLDSKLSHTTTAAGGDALRSGRISHPGRVVRGSAKRINHELRQRLGSGTAPSVQAVVVVWGDFPQDRHTEQEVVYLHGDQLVSWLNELPTKLNAPQRAALITALAEVREELAPALMASSRRNVPRRAGEFSSSSGLLGL